MYTSIRKSSIQTGLMNQDGGNHNMDGLIAVKATDKQGSR